MGEKITSAPLPGTKGQQFPLIASFTIPAVFFLISSISLLHFHQFTLLHQILPNFLGTFVSQSKIPFAFVGIDYFLSYTVSGFFAVFIRGYLAKEGYDNQYPRRDKALLTGLAARAQSAHDSNLDSFPAFAASVIVATLAEVPLDKLIYFSTTYTLARFSFQGFYLANLGLPRSTAYNLGAYSILHLFLFSTVTNYEVYFSKLCQMFLATPF